MARFIRLLLIWCTVIFAPPSLFCQYKINGSATQETCNCYKLTDAQKNEAGSVWQVTKIDLNISFDFTFKVFLGCVDSLGADGIAFILQQKDTNLGTSGNGLGFEDVVPSIGIVLDTWHNGTSETNDPPYDHISIQRDGQIVHGNDLAGPVPIVTSGDVEDCQWHDFRIKWDAATHTLSTYFDSVFRLSTNIDLIADVFGNDPMVFWGFSGATGENFNIQKFCTPLNPVSNSGLSQDALCLGDPVSFKDESISFTTIKSYYWDFGDGTSSTDANPPPHYYAKAGLYEVKHSITAMDNCVSEPFKKVITVGDKPNVSFKVFDTCESITPRIDVLTNVNYGKVDAWQWQLDGADVSSVEKPDFSSLAAGNYVLRLVAATDIGCASDAYSRNFTVIPKPDIAFETKGTCENQSILFDASQVSEGATITSWRWNFDDGSSDGQKNTSHIYENEGIYYVKLDALDANGCTSSIIKPLMVKAAHANAGTDTVILRNTSFQLNGSGGSTYTWSPATGLNDPFIPNPTGTASNDITYFLTVKTDEGCIDTASVKVTIFTRSAVYIPNAFTPNNDGLNDMIKPYFVGIKSLSYFTIYNRWGQKVFTTNDLYKSWDGYYKGQTIGGSYVWVLRAVDLIGKVYEMKGSFVLIK